MAAPLLEVPRPRQRLRRGRGDRAHGAGPRRGRSATGAAASAPTACSPSCRPATAARPTCTSSTRTARWPPCAATASAAWPATWPRPAAWTASSSSRPTPGRAPAPCTAGRRASTRSRSTWGAARIEGTQDFVVGVERVRALRVSMGNPHAVLLDGPDPARAGTLGPAIEAPGAGRRQRRLRPRRPGRRSTSWSGSAAPVSPRPAAPAPAPRRWRRSTRAGWPGRAPVTVRLPGGTLEITVDADLARPDEGAGREGLRGRDGAL